MEQSFDKFDFLDDFMAECEEHIANLNQCLLQWEKDPDSSSCLEKITRELHSLKAASRMMGFKNIESVAHSLEDIFMAYFEGELKLNPVLNDVLLKSLDVVTHLVGALPEEAEGITLSEVITEIEKARLGEYSHIDLTKFEVSLVEAQELPEATSPEGTPDPEEGEDLLPREGEEEEILLPEIGSDSIRVRTKKLDELFNLIGELAICRLRYRESMNTLDQLRQGLEQLDQRHLQLDNSSSSERFLVKKEKGAQKILPELRELNIALGRQMEEDYQFFSQVTEGLRHGIMKTRMLPLHHLFNMIPRMVRDLARQQNKEIELVVEGEDIEIDKKILEGVKEPLIHIVRNAINHGIESGEERMEAGKEGGGKLTISARRQTDQILISVKDDGRGIDRDMVVRRAIEQRIVLPGEVEGMNDLENHFTYFSLPGFSTQKSVSNISGRGVGLDAVKACVQSLKGSVIVQSTLGKDLISLWDYLTLATAHVLVLVLGKETYAVPIHSVQEIVLLRSEMIEKVEDKDAIYIRDRTVPLLDLARVLNRSQVGGLRERAMAVVVSNALNQLMAFAVDDILGEEEIVVKSLGNQVRKARFIQGASIMGRGEVLLILNVGDLLEAGRELKSGEFSKAYALDKSKELERQLQVLVVDDSITTRRLEQAILKSAGYEVDVAVNGENALEKLERGNFDIVISDVQMPVMDGLELTRRIKAHSKWSQIPVIIVSSMDGTEDLNQGFEAGAQAYITKGQFNQETLIELINRLVVHV